MKGVHDRHVMPTCDIRFFLNSKQNLAKFAHLVQLAKLAQLDQLAQFVKFFLSVFAAVVIDFQN